MKKHEMLINLTKDRQDLYIENYKTLLRKIKENLNRLRDILCSWIGRLNIVKMSVLKLNHLSRNSRRHFIEMDKVILKFI